MITICDFRYQIGYILYVTRFKIQNYMYVKLYVLEDLK